MSSGKVDPGANRGAWINGECLSVSRLLKTPISPTISRYHNHFYSLKKVTRPTDANHARAVSSNRMIGQQDKPRAEQNRQHRIHLSGDKEKLEQPYDTVGN